MWPCWEVAAAFPFSILENVLNGLQVPFQSGAATLEFRAAGPPAAAGGAVANAGGAASEAVAAGAGAAAGRATAVAAGVAAAVADAGGAAAAKLAGGESDGTGGGTRGGTEVAAPLRMVSRVHVDFGDGRVSGDLVTECLMVQDGGCSKRGLKASVDGGAESNTPDSYDDGARGGKGAR